MEIILEQPGTTQLWSPSQWMYPSWKDPIDIHWPPMGCGSFGVKAIGSLGCGRSPGTILALRVGPSLVVPEVDFFGGRGSKLVDNSKSFQIVESIFACIWTSCLHWMVLTCFNHLFGKSLTSAGPSFGCPHIRPLIPFFNICKLHSVPVLWQGYTHQPPPAPWDDDQWPHSGTWSSRPLRQCLATPNTFDPGPWSSMVYSNGPRFCFFLGSLKLSKRTMKQEYVRNPRSDFG